MPNVINATPQPIKIEYLLDTLFGVNALTSECMAQMVSKAPSVQLRLTPPWPAQLKNAHRIAFEWDGSAYRGVVHHAELMPDGDLLLDIDTAGQ
ncbi:hypothetical protein BK648_24855 [Pseudomonas poae]|uniref:Uncharacterized protein n=1 Tax=Pseudomonas poae TaxID=200451 RepID=A0A423ERS1_9PSED|nr:hypothetical protein [Pseudomonas poae]ROM33987.1 hypothetical protein BK648_24855 [Pseudomonas poae]